MKQYKITIKDKKIIDVLEFDSRITILNGTDTSIKVYITADLQTVKKEFKKIGVDFTLLKPFL